MKCRILLLTTALLLVKTNFLQAQIITTIAGNGQFNFRQPQPPGPALSFSFSTLQGMSLDKAGNCYIADLDNNYIWKLDVSGNISVFAGTGATGYSGDGGPAVAATISGPSWTHVDEAGNVFFADQSQAPMYG